MSHEATITVACTAIPSGWRCAVDVDDDDGRTAGRHEVTVARAGAVRLAAACGTADDERLVLRGTRLPARP